MSPASLNRLQILATVVAAVGLLFAVGLTTPGTAGAAGHATCTMHRAGAGDPAAIRVRCVGDKPSATRSLGTSFRRAGATCRIEHLGAIDPAAFRLVCT